MSPITNYWYMEYWEYYDDNFDWNSENMIAKPDFEYTIQLLQKNGVSKDNAIELYKSGYVCIPEYEVLIDRFYGGPLLSYDLKTRFSLKHANDLLTLKPCSPVTLKKVKSIEELISVVDSMKGSRQLVFRGQIKNYFIDRKINNPHLTIKDYGEISLLPSIWRRMYNKNQQSFTEFNSLSLFEWSHIFYSAFDLEEIEKRHKALTEAGEFISTMSEMEDCSDEMLREFGKFRMDLSMGKDYNLLPTLTTLLQHYGLLSPVLDLTESLEVALFFATHKYQQTEALSNYKFIGSNDKQAVVYVLDYVNVEMQRHNERDDFLKYLEPQRPVKQKCVICQTNQYSINLPALYLKSAIILDFNISNNISGLTAEDIFPYKDEDKFLKALYEKIHIKDHVTIFSEDDL